MTDDEIVEKIARAIIIGLPHPEGPDTKVSGFTGGKWEPLGPMWKVEYVGAARAALSVMRSEIDAAVLKERETCAKACEELVITADNDVEEAYDRGLCDAATAIRARSEKLND